MSPMIELTVRLQAAAGQEQALADALHTLVLATRAEQGCLRFDAARSTDDPAIFILIERWATQAAFEAHGTTPHLGAFAARHPVLLAVPPAASFWQALVPEAVAL